MTKNLEICCNFTITYSEKHFEECNKFYNVDKCEVTFKS